MATAKKDTTLAVRDNFAIANRYEGLDPELLAELKDEMEYLDPENGILCRQIKIPSGGGIAYEVQGEDDDDTDAMKEIEGVIVFTHRLSAFWPSSYGGDDGTKAPVCSSMDGKTGLNSQTGEVIDCEKCPYNQYGSATDQQGNRARGKACKNMRRLYILMNGDPNIYLLTVPPTSIRDVNKQLSKLTASGIPQIGAVVSLTLEKAKNGSGVAYSKVVIKKKALLSQAAANKAKLIREELKTQYQSMAITLDDYTGTAAASPKGQTVDVYPTAEEAAAMGGVVFEEAPPHDDGDAPLPF
ncbi:MAG: hypothetical protein K2O18_06205 [Oscillospiraceae bacterium]|nr:hypothetical protein [Oscillospiraceae bacterium]